VSLRHAADTQIVADTSTAEMSRVSRMQPSTELDDPGEANEDVLTARIARTMRRQLEKDYPPAGTKRDAHPKHTGLFEATSWTAWRIRMKATAVLVALLPVVACSSHQSVARQEPRRSPSPRPSAEAIVTFCQPVDYPEKPPSEYLVVDGGAAIPVTTPEGQPLQVSRGDFDQDRRWYFDDHGRWLWAKSGLVVRGNTGIEISTPLDSPLRIDWGEQPNLVPRRSLRVECSQNTPQWMALIGGYFANSKGCFPLDIRVGDRPTVQIHVQMGAACPQGMTS
jgi:hypothetical protein